VNEGNTEPEARQAGRYGKAGAEAHGQGKQTATAELRDAGKGFDGSTWETADPERPFTWADLGLEEVPESSLSDYMSA